MKSTLLRGAANVLLVLITHALLHRPADSFQLWSNRLTRALSASRQDPNEPVHRRPQLAPTTTPTTTSTTTPAPQLELHFEINPNDLEQYQRQQQEHRDLNELSDLINQQSANGTLILEDLVNQFERNFNSARTAKTNQEEQQDLLDNRNESQQVHFREPAAPNEQQHLQTISADILTRDKSAQYVMSGASHQAPKVGDLRVSAYQDETTTGSSSGANDLLVEAPFPPELDPDRHIQYDTYSASIADDELDMKRAMTEQLLQRRLDQELDRVSSLSAGKTNSTKQKRISGRESQNANSTANKAAAVLPLLTVSGARNVSAVSATTNRTGSSNSSATSLDDPASNLTSTYRSLGPTQAQARSMSGPSSRLPSSAKAPYASYNLFSQRSDANNKSPGANATLAPGDNQTAAPANKSAETDSSSPPNGTELVNSINKISSHLAGEDSRVEPTTAASRTVAAPTTTTTSTTTSTTTTPRPLTLVDQLQAYLNSGGTNFNSRLDQRDVLERVASKLGPVNDLVELDPLPSETHAATLQQKQPAMSERFFAGSSPSPQRRNSHEDRYLSVGEFDPSGGNQLNPIEFFSGPSENQMILPVRINEMRAPDLSNFVSSFPGESLPASNGVDVDIENTPAPVLHRKTIETLSSQIKSSDHNLLAASTNTMAVHQHRERSPAQQQQAALPNHQALNRGMSGSGGTFAAALINVTAPMVLPLSASEAMEASMASLNKQHAQDAHRASAQQHLPPHRSGYYAISQPVHDSIYSRPMNQFRPTTPAPHDLADREGPSLLSAAERERMRIGDFHQSASMGTSTVPASQLASGFRSPPNQFQGGAQTTMMAASGWPSLAGYGHTTSLPTPASYLNGLEAATPSTTSLSPLSSSPAPSSTSSSASKFASSTPATPTGSSSATPTSSSNNRPSTAPGRGQTNSTGSVSSSPGITNGFITGSVVNTTLPATQIDLIQAATGSAPSAAGSISSQVVGGQQQQQAGPGKRLFNLTRVEHISAECSNDLIRTIIIFNGTFKGIIYSSGYVRDPNCLYINGTGKTRYDFSIRLNQCGTLGRQEIHSPSGPDEVRRRDQVMWNSLSIQYNPIIEQEWDEHFRVSCEYGSDFWKTISFSPFNVETNTGSPVVFTVDPPQCQMEILKGHGMVGPRQEAISGPVTVGDPLTLLIHMKSEKAGYDILVKNCIAHNGGQQKMQLIDSNGCVVNERFISPFRGTYNDNDLKHVTLYSYLKAFRFTGSPVLYLECEVHMCQSACPPQMCYWRRLSKRSLGQSLNGTRIGHNATSLGADMQLGLQELAGSVETSTATSVDSKVAGRRGRTGRQLKSDAESAQSTTSNSNNLSDKISLFQALEVRQERFPEPDAAATSLASRRAEQDKASDVYEANGAGISQLMCYQRVEIFAFLFTVASILLAAVSVTIGCYCRASSLKRQSMSHRLETSAAKIRYALQRHPLTNSLSLANSANMCYSPISSISSLASSTSSSSPPLASPVSSGGNNRGQLHSNFGPKNSSASTANSDTGAQLYATNSAKCDELARHDRRYCRPFDLAFAVQSNQSRPVAGGQKQLAPSCNINHERLLAAKLARRG